MNRVIERRMIVPNLHLLTLEAPEIARKVRPGQFVIVRPDDEGERIPLSVADWDAAKGTLSVVFMEVGASTGGPGPAARPGTPFPPAWVPSAMQRRSPISAPCSASRGCYGIGSIYPVCRELKKAGNRVVDRHGGEKLLSRLLAEGARRRLVQDHRTVTRDGSLGAKGHVTGITDFIKEQPKVPDRVIVNGCTFLMARTSEATRSLGIPTVVNLNPIMIDGTGMCGVCRVTVAGRTRFACVDGPEFSGHDDRLEGVPGAQEGVYGGRGALHEGERPGRPNPYRREVPFMNARRAGQERSGRKEARPEPPRDAEAAARGQAAELQRGGPRLYRRPCPERGEEVHAVQEAEVRERLPRGDRHPRLHLPCGQRGFRGGHQEAQGEELPARGERPRLPSGGAVRVAVPPEEQERRDRHRQDRALSRRLGSRPGRGRDPAPGKADR